MTPLETLRLAVAHHQAGRFEEAGRLYRQVLEREPNHAQGLHLFGLLLHQRGEHEAASELIGRAIAVSPAVADFHSNLAAVLRAAGHAARAARAARDALAIREFPDAHHNLGLALVDSGDLVGAERAFRRALELQPRFPQAWDALGSLLLRLGRTNDAIAAYRQAVALEPGFANAYNNLGAALDTGGDTEAAIAAFRAALALDPKSAETHNNLAEALRVFGNVDEAIAGFQEALRLDPRLAVAHSNLLYAMQFSPRFSADEVFQAHRDWATRHADPLTAAAAPHRREEAGAGRPLRIGYVSPDLCEHPVGRFLLPALLGRDRQRSHVTCYSSGTRNDAMTRRLAEASDVWREAATLSDAALAEMIRADAIDVLVDLAGHTSGNRLPCFALRPAPVQATYLGYPDTTGMSAIDWRLTDSVADPPGETDRRHTERLVRLAGCAWCYIPPDDAAEVAPFAGGGPVRFGSFNNLAKLSPPTIDLWARVLHAVPDSRLVLKALALRWGAAAQRIVDAFAARGISAGRLEVLRPTDSSASHLAAYAGVDVALDAFPYSGTTTTCESLWMGVPVVSLAGERHVSRVSASLLTAVGLTDLVATSPDQYVAVAAALAGSDDRRRELRHGLRGRMLQSPLTDVGRFASELDDAFGRMWTQWCRGD